MTFAGLAFITVGLLSKQFSLILFGKDYTLFVIITGSSLAFQAIYSFFSDLIRFELRPWMYTMVSVSNLLISISLNIYFILILKQGVWGALLAGVISNSLMTVVTITYVFKRYKFGFSKKWATKILKYGTPLIGTALAVWILNTTDRYFLAHYQSVSNVGIYSVGAKLASLLGLVSGALQMAWAPFALDLQYEFNAKKIYAKVFLIYFVINILGVFFISMFSIDILKVFTQPGYYSAKAVVPFLCMSVVFWSGYFIVAIGIGISKKAQHTIWITLLAAGFNIILNYLLTPSIGALGASFSIMCANFLIFILTLNVSQSLYYIKYDYLKITLLALPAAAIVGLSYYFNFNLPVRLAFSASYFIASTLFLWKSYKHSPEIKSLLVKIKNMKLKKELDKTV